MKRKSPEMQVTCVHCGPGPTHACHATNGEAMVKGRCRRPWEHLVAEQDGRELSDFPEGLVVKKPELVTIDKLRERASGIRRTYCLDYRHPVEKRK